RAVGDAAGILRPRGVDHEALLLRALKLGLLDGAVAEVVVLIWRIAHPRGPGHAGQEELALGSGVGAVGERELPAVRAQRRIGGEVVLALVVLELVPPLRAGTRVA